MTNVRKLVARLNASTCRFDVGRGGIPELTPQDIAAALGMVKDELAREVFCAVWWPDGARLNARGLDLLLARVQFAEWRRRMEKMLDAQLAVAASRADRNAEAEQRGESMLAEATAQMWPALVQEAYALVRRAVLDELRAPEPCAECDGVGSFVHRGREADCTGCGGSGRVARSNRQRAMTMDRDEAAYRRTWRGVYEWTLRRVQEAEQTGGTALAKRLAA